MIEKLEVFCLTLERSKSRRKLFSQEWIKLNKNLDSVTFVYGIDGSKEELNKYIYTNYLGHFISSNVLACSLSHILLLKKISELDPRKFYIVIEDDTILDLNKVKENYNKINTLTNNGVVYLFGNVVELEEDSITAKWIQSTECFTLKPKLAKKIFDYFMINGFDTHIDLSIMYRIKFNRYYLPIAQSLLLETTMSSKNEKFILKSLQSNNIFYYYTKLPLISILNIEFNAYMILLIIALIIFSFVSDYFFYFEKIIFFIFGLLMWDVLEKTSLV